MDDGSIHSLDITMKTPIFESTAISASHEPKLSQQTFMDPSKEQPWEGALDTDGDELQQIIKENSVGDLDDDFFEQNLTSQSDCVEAEEMRSLSSSFFPLASEMNPGRHGQLDIETSKQIAHTQSSIYCAPPCVQGSRESHENTLVEASMSPRHTSSNTMSSKREDICCYESGPYNSHDGSLSKSPGVLSPISPTFRPSPVTKSRIDPRTQSFEEIRLPEMSVLQLSDNDPSQSNNSNTEAKRDIALSPWEKWMLKKTKEDLERRETSKIEKLSRQRHEAECREAAARRKAKSAVVHKEWVKQKMAEQLARKEKECARVATQKKMEEERRKASLAKAASCYEEWYKKREEERQKLQAKRKEKAKQEALRAQELRQKSDHAYRVWFKTVGCRKLDNNLLNISNSSR